MIKIEALTGTATITRGDEECALFVGMIVDAQELDTLKTTGDVVYCIDEGEIITIAGTAKPAAPIAAKTVETAPAA